MIKSLLSNLIASAVEEIGLPAEKIELFHPELSFGDFSTNIALVLAKKNNEEALKLAEKIKTKILSLKNENLKDVQVAGPGFLNFTLSEDFFAESLKEILMAGENFGRNNLLEGKKVLIEYTDPNPFKLFHIGHLMSNTIGETLSRIIEASGAEVKRACYQGDVGMHVAKTLWGMVRKENELPEKDANLLEKVAYLGQCYTLGAYDFENNQEAKEGIIILNKKIYKKSDDHINKLYELGRQWSLDYFETIYKLLGTDHNQKEGKAFDYYFFESETWAIGQKLVEDGLAKGVFEKSEGAVVFRGDLHDVSLHTRVFINNEGLPTYEAKDLGLTKLKFEKYPFDLSISVTGEEQREYFKVMLKAMEQIMPDLAAKTKHIAHGMLRLPTGKMSSRTGDVITAKNLIGEVSEKVLEKIGEREIPAEEKKQIAEAVAVGALKYSILKQSPGQDIIFDFAKSLSFEGDSGPYLQYTYARICSVLSKAGEQGKEIGDEVASEESTSVLARLLYQLPEVIEKSYLNLSPQTIVSYLINIAGAFNGFYAQNKIIGSEEESSRLALTKATSIVLKNGLNILAIPVLEKM